MAKFTNCLKLEEAKTVKGLPPFISVQHAARLLLVHPNTIRRWAKNGLLKSYRFGSTLRIPAEGISEHSMGGV